MAAAMTARGLKADASAAVRDRLSPLGFKKRAGAILTLEIAPNVLGWLGLNSAYRRPEARLDVNPVVGVRHQEVQRIVSELRGEPPHGYIPPTVSTPLGYVTPAGRYTPWSFSKETIESATDDLAATVEAHGLTFMRRNVELDEICQSLEDGFGLYDDYTLPVVLSLLHRHKEARRVLVRSIDQLGDRDDAAALELRSFADAFDLLQPPTLD